MQDLNAALTGISGILVTPYDAEGEIAPARLAPIIDRALGAGMHIPVVNGNTGEFYALTTDEACTMVREVCAMVDGRAPVLGGVGRGIRDACRLAREKGGDIVHLDVTLICEAPKIGPHRDAMRRRIAEICGMAMSHVSVKATTHERIGTLGRGEGIAAMATATVMMPAATTEAAADLDQPAGESQRE